VVNKASAASDAHAPDTARTWDMPPPHFADVVEPLSSKTQGLPVSLLADG
jgi:hypothetical protein